MSDTASPSPNDDRPFEENLDRELNLRGIVLAGLGTLVLIGLAGAVVWGIAVFLRHSLEAKDPPPPPLPEARQPAPPPEPRLQASPSRDLQLYMSEQESVLGTYGWVDQERGIARIPVERAMELALEEGLETPPGGEPSVREGGEAP